MAENEILTYIYIWSDLNLYWSISLPAFWLRSSAVSVLIILIYTALSFKVKFKHQMHCKSLNEDQFGPVISENYYEEGLFWFELDHQQTEKLISLFVSAPVNVNKSQHQKKVEHRLELKSSGTSEVRQGNISSKENVLKPETSYPAQGKMALSYSAVVKNSSCPPEEWDSKHIKPNVDSACNVNYERDLDSSEPKQEGEHFIKAASDNDSSSSDKAHTEWVHSIIETVLDEESESSGSPRFVATQEDQRQMDSLDLQYILTKVSNTYIHIFTNDIYRMNFNFVPLLTLFTCNQNFCVIEAGTRCTSIEGGPIRK